MLRTVMLVAALACAVASLTGAQQNDPDKQEWLQLFNGRDLDGWTAKFANTTWGENFNDTVRVENGMLEVRYDEWQTFDNDFGDMYDREPFSYYRLAAEYRFVGDQVPGGPAWAMRNNGLMLHSQKLENDAEESELPDLNRGPASGRAGDRQQRSTANVCTPGYRDVFMNGQMSAWALHQFEVCQAIRGRRVGARGSGSPPRRDRRHIINGVTVLEYEKPQIGGGYGGAGRSGDKEGWHAADESYSTIQAERHRRFPEIQLLNLEDCKDPKASNYKTYFVYANPQMCKY